MGWREEIATQRKQVIERWFKSVVESYPEETATFLKSEKNPFLNPVGAAIKEGLEGVIEWIVAGSENADLVPFLDRIIRIRAVQQFRPSEALRFMTDLRRIVHTLIPSREDLSFDDFDETVDKLMMTCFDLFMKCREDLYEVRLQEVKNRSFRLLQRAGFLYELADPQEESVSDANP